MCCLQDDVGSVVDEQMIEDPMGITDFVTCGTKYRTSKLPDNLEVDELVGVGWCMCTCLLCDMLKSAPRGCSVCRDAWSGGGALLPVQWQ